MWIKIKRNKDGKVDNTTLPQLPGKYVVKTKTIMGNEHKVWTSFCGEHFTLKNQISTEWLDETNL